MVRHRFLTRIASLALLGALAAAPATALADPAGTAKTGEAKHKAPRFPMDAKAFRDLVDKHIEIARKHLDTELGSNTLPAATQAEIKKKFEEATKTIRAAVDRVASDGTVTKDEATEVRHLARKLRRETIAKLRREERRNRG